MIQSIHPQTGHGIWPICQVLGVPRNSDYHASELTPCQSADLVIGLEIESIFKRHRRRYRLIFHRDCGSQYGSRAHRQILEAADIHQSMSARANLYHNAWTESFMSTLKNEILQGGSFATEADARIDIFDFIESYDNHHGKHSALGYRTPAQFETKIYTNN